jgi:hypothetical protein
MGDFAGLDAFEELHQPVSLLMPILRAHQDLRISPPAAQLFSCRRNRARISS